MKINGERIRQEMKKKHITQRKLADEIGADRSEISRWINGSRGMKAKYIYKLSKSLDIKVDEITEGKAIIFPKMVAVVRCKDCSFYRDGGTCALHSDKWKLDGFCSWAVKKKGR